MDEERWLRCQDPREMLDFLRRRKPKPSERKLRLYCVACCRWLWSVMEEPCRATIEVAERFADAQASVEHVRGCWAVDLLLGRE